MAETWKVLLVEDDEVDREAVRRALARSDVVARIVEAADVTSAVTMMIQEVFDCAIVDYQLPDGSAWDILDARDIREHVSAGALVDPPIIILTGQGNESVAVEFLSTGACDYVPKSDLTPARIGQAVKNAVRVARLRRDAARTQDGLIRAESCCLYLFSRSADPLLLVDTDGRIHDANPAACEVLGVPHDAIAGRSVAELFPPEFQSELLRRTGADGAAVDVASSQVRLVSGDPSARFELVSTKATSAGRPAVLLHLRRSVAGGGSRQSTVDS